MTYLIRQPGIALAALATVATLGSSAAQAQTFARADISLDRFGNLECRFRETGLAPGTTVRYDCTATDVGVLQQCVLKNKPVGDSQLLVFHNVHAHEVENFVVKSNGTVNAAVVTEIPESESNSITCTEPAELTVTAVRWCNASLVDLTNTIIAVTVSELFDQLVPNGAGSVPSCATLLTLPGVTPGE